MRNWKNICRFPTYNYFWGDLKAVTAHGVFGRWHFETAWAPGEVRDILIDVVENSTICN